MTALVALLASLLAACPDELSLHVTQACAEAVTVELRQACLAQPADGIGAAVVYDHTRLAFDSGTYSPCYLSPNHPVYEWSYYGAVIVSASGGDGSDCVVATLTFDVLPGATETGEFTFFDYAGNGNEGPNTVFWVNPPGVIVQPSLVTAASVPIESCLPSPGDFVQALLIGHPSADANGDGAVNGLDIAAYVNALLE